MIRYVVAGLMIPINILKGIVLWVLGIFYWVFIFPYSEYKRDIKPKKHQVFYGQKCNVAELPDGKIVISTEDGKSYVLTKEELDKGLNQPKN